MKALILAAGLGKRLRPLTDEMPKALINVGGVPMIHILINKLIKSGITEIIVNVHYKAEQLISYIYANDFGIPITISDETEKLLDTGGAIKGEARIDIFYGSGEIARQKAGHMKNELNLWMLVPNDYLAKSK